MANKRNSSIELLRTIAAISVIFLHYNNVGGGFSYVTSGMKFYYLWLSESLCICAVDLFILISAYFLSATCKRKLVKVVDMIVQVVVFSCFFYFAELLSGESFSTIIFINKILPSNYFVILYSVVYILSPYVNIMLEQLSVSSFKKLLTTVFMIFSVWTFFVDILCSIPGITATAMSTIGAYGSQFGYTIVNFLLMYIIGAYIRFNDISIPKKNTICGIMISTAIIFVSAIIEDHMGCVPIKAWFYNNPVVIALATFVFLFFKELKIENKRINELAKGAFTCFLFHGSFMLLWGVPGIEKATSSNVIVLMLHQIAVGVCLYIVSYMVYRVYSIFGNWFTHLIIHMCDKVDLSVQ